MVSLMKPFEHVLEENHYDQQKSTILKLLFKNHINTLMTCDVSEDVSQNA